MDFYSDDDSDPEFDEGLQEDLDLVRRSCILSGADPDAAVAKVSSYLSAGPAPGAAGGADANDSSDEEDEDLALVRSIRANLHLNKASPSSPLPDSEPRPICVWPPSDTDDDDEDDLETLRAIQRRFSHYHAGESTRDSVPSGTSTGSLKNMKNETSKGLDGELIAHRPDVEDVEKQNPKALTQTGFPKAALLLVDALKKNRACQKFIRMKMINIEARIEVNKELRDRVKCLMDYQLSCRKSFGKILCQKEDPRVRLISSRKPSEQPAKNKYKKMSALFLGPAENPHVSKYKLVLKQFPMSLQKQSWSDAEKEKLAKGMKQQYQETLIVDSINNGRAYALTNTARDFEVTPESLRSVLPLIKWDNIASMYLPGRSGAECQARWLNLDDPLINQNAWTAQEEKRLILIVQNKGMHNWINIAVELGTHRTPFQCLARYQRSLNPHILKRVWTKEEDLQLLAAVETFGCNWQLVSASLDGRTGNQCSNRWRKTLIPERTRVGRWFPDEDKRLVVSVKLFGSGSWNKIAQFIPGRTQSQCNERWSNVLDPDIDLGEWRPEEDSKLLASVCEVGRCWSKIAKVLIPHRTDNMCLRRWEKLRRDELPSVKAANQVKKTIFQSNFVDRETERPAIGPSDFPSLVHSKVDRGDDNTVSDQVRKPRKRSERSREDDPSANDASNSCACVDSADTDVAAVNTTTTRPRKKLSGRCGKQTGENLAMYDAVDNSSNRCSTTRKRKCPANNNEAVQTRMRVSVSVDNETTLEILGGSIGLDNEVPTNLIKGSVSFGNEGAVKKRMRGSVSVGNEGAVKKRMRGSICAGDEGAVKKRMRGSVSTDNHGAATKRKRASRKSVKDNSTTDGVVNAAPELDLPSVPSEERDVDTGNVNKMRRKSTPRPKQINMTEGAGMENSTCTRLADCMSFARINGTNRNKSCSVRPLSNVMQSNGPSNENLQVPTMVISVENGTAKTSDDNQKAITEV